MIEAMSNRTNSLGFKIVFALIAVSFVLGGIGTGLMIQDTSAAKVNGEEISQQAFRNAKQRQEHFLNEQLGEQFADLMDNPTYVQEFNRNILNTLINDELLRQYAQELKLGVTADQIKQEIVSSPAFQQEGKFSNDLYQQTLRNNGLSADQYAAMVGQGIILSQIEQAVFNSHFSLPAEQAQLAKLLLQQREVRLARFPLAESLAKQVATDEEVTAYYQNRKADFRNPEQLSVEYVEITPKDVMAKVQVTDEQIETYYQTNLAQFTTQGEANIAHIQLADEAQANEVVQQLQNGADFAVLAKERSQDTLSAAQGGQLGWAKAGTFPAEFEAAVATLQAGQSSGVVKVDNAYHVIKVLERKEASQIPLEKVKTQISELIRQELVLQEYSNITREMANQAFENRNTLEPVAAAGGVKVQKTERFTRSNPPQALANEKVLKALFNSELRQNNQNSEALEIGTADIPHTLFVRVAEYQAENEQTLEQARTAVELAVKREKAEKALTEQAESALKAVEAGDLQAVNFAPKVAIDRISQQLDPQLSEQIFTMAKPSDKTVYQIARAGNGDVVLVALDQVTDGQPSEFAPLAVQFAQSERSELQRMLLNDLRQRAKVEINQEFLDDLDRVQ